MVYPFRAAARLLPRALLLKSNRAGYSAYSGFRPLSSSVSSENRSVEENGTSKSMLMYKVLNQYTVPDLKDLCRTRGLPLSGKKADLQERLRANLYKDGGATAEKSTSTSHVRQESSVRTTRSTPPPVSEVREIRNEFCFDRAANFRLVPVCKLEQEGRMERDAVFSPAMTVQDETSTLIQLLPEELALSLEDSTLRSQLMEVVLDVGRRPFAWVNGKRLFLGEDCDYKLTQDQLAGVVSNLHFGADNRAGINGSLHRISSIRNRDGVAVGATLRVGRYVPGNAIMIADILLGSNCSILFVGPPGSAKTSIIRDAARLLADDHSVVIVDTSSEIGGAGDIPHECIGLSRRMQVKHIDVQAAVMVECVQNHTPSVMVIDEIGRPAEVSAALTCKERGVRIIASAHGNMPGLVRNATLWDLVGGVDVVTVGDAMARQDSQRNGGGNPSKLRAQRKGRPIFDVIVELKRGYLHEWQIVLNTAAAVDSILSSGNYEAQIRTRSASGTACSLQIRNVKHDINRDKIIEEASKVESSTLHNMIPSYNGEEPSYAPKVDPFRKECRVCPVCSQIFFNRRGMITHALNKRVCYVRLPSDVINHFRHELSVM